MANVSGIVYMCGKIPIISDAIDNAWNGVTSAVGNVLNWVGSFIGIYDHDELVNGVQVTNLLTPGAMEKAMRKSAKYSSKGIAKEYSKTMGLSKKKYRRQYSKQFLESVGYNPSSTATTWMITTPKVKAWLASNYGYLETQINSASDKYLTLANRLAYGKQGTAGFNPDTGKLISGGKTYSFVSGYDVNATTVSLLWRRDYEEAITENLVNNYSYDYVNHTVVIGGLVYGLGEFSGSIVNGNYSIIAVRSGKPDVEILTPVEDITTSYSNADFDNEVTWIEYSVLNGGVVGTGTRYVMAPARSLPLYDNTVIDITAIIPMKENNQIVDLGNNNLVRMLKKLNLSGDQFADTLANSDIDAAYLMTALDVRIDNPAHNKLAFQMFDLISSGSGDITVSISQLNMTYKFSLVKEEITGVVGAVGSYTRTLEQVSNGDSTDWVLTLWYQGSSTTYKKLTVSGFNLKYTVSGQWVSVSLGQTNGSARLVIPLNLLNDLTFGEWVDVYENSLCFLAYSEKVVRVQWYETPMFGFVLKVVAIVLMVLPGGQGFGSALMKIAITVAVLWVAQQIAIMIGGPLGTAIGTAIAIYATYTMGYYDANAVGGTWLQAANTGLSVVNQTIQHEMDQMVAGYNAWMERMKDQYSEIADRLKEYDEKSLNGDIIQNAILNAYTGYYNNEVMTTSQYVGSIINTEQIMDGSWMYDVDYQVNKRISVANGVHV